jgi:hypothetical protein
MNQTGQLEMFEKEAKMADRVAVVPAKPNMNLRHPIDGLLKDEGSDWTIDQFTAVLLREKSIFRTDDKDRPVFVSTEKKSEGAQSEDMSSFERSRRS